MRHFRRISTAVKSVRTAIGRPMATISDRSLRPAGQAELWVCAPAAAKVCAINATRIKSQSQKVAVHALSKNRRRAASFGSQAPPATYS